jgi:hypothetical protein
MRILGERETDWAKGQVDWPIVDVEVCEVFLEVKYGGFVLRNLSGSSRPSTVTNKECILRLTSKCNLQDGVEPKFRKRLASAGVDLKLRSDNHTSAHQLSLATQQSRALLYDFGAEFRAKSCEAVVLLGGSDGHKSKSASFRRLASPAFRCLRSSTARAKS